MRGSDYRIGEMLTLVTFQGGEYPVTVVGHSVLPDDLVVFWRGLRPLAALSAVNDRSTICMDQLKEVRREP